MRFKQLITVVIVLLMSAQLSAQSTKLTVQVDKPIAEIQPTMWGIFFEDINLGADGGLYAELVKNRSFEFPDPMMGWTKETSGSANGSLTIQTGKPFNTANSHYLRVETDRAGFGFGNDGFRGIGVREGENYDFSAQVRAISGKPSLLVQLVNPAGKVLAKKKIDGLTSAWKKHTAVLQVEGSEPKARLNIILEGKGTVDFDMVSLFPQKTWKNRPGGLRADMVQLLSDLKPGFLRFP